MAATHRKGARPRSLTTMERREVARLAKGFQSTPPWSGHAHTRNDDFRRRIVELYDSGATLDALASACGWDPRRVLTAIRKGRAAGFAGTATTFTAPPPGPTTRKPTRTELAHARTLLDRVRDTRDDAETVEIELLRAVRSLLDHIRLAAIAAHLHLPEDSLRLRMKTLQIGRFRNPLFGRPMTAADRAMLAGYKTRYTDAFHDYQQARQSLIAYLRTLTGRGVTQGSIADGLGVTRQTVSGWLKTAPPTAVEPPRPVSPDFARTARRKYRNLPKNAAGGVLWKSDDGRDLADLLWQAHQDGASVSDLSRALRMPSSVLGKVMSLYRTQAA